MDVVRSEACQFGAITLSTVAEINQHKCVGCGICVVQCEQEALTLVRRPEEEILLPPENFDDWMAARAAARGIPMDTIL